MKKQVLTIEVEHLRRWSLHNTSIGVIRRSPIKTPKEEGQAAAALGEGDLLLFQLWTLEVEEGEIEVAFGGALTKGSEPLEMTSVGLTCFPLFFCKRALARALLSNLGAMSAKIKTSQGRLGGNINT